MATLHSARVLALQHHVKQCSLLRLPMHSLTCGRVASPTGVYGQLTTLHRQVYLPACVLHTTCSGQQLRHRQAVAATSGQSSIDSSSSGSYDSIDTSPSSSSAALAAFEAGNLGFGFAAAGLLFPYYIGVVAALQEMRILTPDTKLAGASAGSLIVMCFRSGLSLQLVTNACLDLAKDCRRNGTRFRLRYVLEGVLREVLPDNVHEACSGNTFVAVTRVLPSFTPELVYTFHDREDVINTLLTSCHIPWYFNGSPTTKYRGGVYFDGGAHRARLWPGMWSCTCV